MIAGFGFRAAATEASLRDALARAAGDRPVAALAAPDDKAAATCLLALAKDLAVPVRSVSAQALRAANTLTLSPRVNAARGAGSVAEAAALAAAGPGARLIGPRAVLGRSDGDLRHRGGRRTMIVHVIDAKTCARLIAPRATSDGPKAATCAIAAGGPK